MNLLALQRCKEEAEKMVQDPHTWIHHLRMSSGDAQIIRHQGLRTLEVVRELERYRKAEKQVSDKEGQ